MENAIHLEGSLPKMGAEHGILANSVSVLVMSLQVIHKMGSREEAIDQPTDLLGF